MKLFICGYARHGKDTAARFLHEMYGLTFESSSMFCMKLFLRQQLAAEFGITYDTYAACFEDRMNRRVLWHELIVEYNRLDPSRLSRKVFEQYDIYVGIRSKVELDAARRLSSLVLWIDRPGYPVEPKASNKLSPNDCDVIVSADSIQDMHTKLKRLFDCLSHDASKDRAKREDSA